MILVTGGAGYIGSHCAVEFLKNGHEILIFDDFSKGHREIIKNLKLKYNIVFVEGDLKNKADIDFVFKNYKIDTAIHFAAFSEVSNSILKPDIYYKNNILGTLNLLNSMVENNVLSIVFSSSAAVYGEAKYIPIDENHPLKPINPYGKTKYIIEEILEDYDRAYGLKSIKLRYFNVIGADYEENIGEWHDVETHLVPNILKSALKENFIFKIFGNDYKTNDGTCVRDYVDVRDLVYAHFLAYKYLKDYKKSDIFNLGSNKGYSVKEIYDTVCKALNYKIPYEVVKRRNGDPQVLLADSNKAKDVLNWSAKKTLMESIQSAYEWEKILMNYQI